MAETAHRPGLENRRRVPARLIEAQSGAYALGHWILASPLLIFLLWLWTDIFAHLSPLTPYWIDALIGIVLFVMFVVIPIGYAAHRLVTALPGIFQHAGWDVQPLEPVPPEKQYTTRYVYEDRQRAPTTARRILARAGQGWVYLEIAAVFAGAVAMIPLFFSALDFGFGQ